MKLNQVTALALCSGPMGCPPILLSPVGYTPLQLPQVNQHIIEGGLRFPLSLMPLKVRGGQTWPTRSSRVGIGSRGDWGSQTRCSRGGISASLCNRHKSLRGPRLCPHSPIDRRALPCLRSPRCPRLQSPVNGRALPCQPGRRDFRRHLCLRVRVSTALGMSGTSIRS